jgi:hypothetical protein
MAKGGKSAGRGEWDKWIAGLPTISTPSGESGGLTTQAIVAVQLGAQRVPSNPTTRSNSGWLLASGKNNPATPAPLRRSPPPGLALHPFAGHFARSGASYPASKRAEGRERPQTADGAVGDNNMRGNAKRFILGTLYGTASITDPRDPTFLFSIHRTDPRSRPPAPPPRSLPTAHWISRWGQGVCAGCHRVLPPTADRAAQTACDPRCRYRKEGLEPPTPRSENTLARPRRSPSDPSQTPLTPLHPFSSPPLLVRSQSWTISGHALPD